MKTDAHAADQPASKGSWNGFNDLTQIAPAVGRGDKNVGRTLHVLPPLRRVLDHDNREGCSPFRGEANQFRIFKPVCVSWSVLTGHVCEFRQPFSLAEIFSKSSRAFQFEKNSKSLSKLTKMRLVKTDQKPETGLQMADWLKRLWFTFHKEKDAGGSHSMERKKRGLKKRASAPALGVIPRHATSGHGSPARDVAHAPMAEPVARSSAPA